MPLDNSPADKTEPPDEKSRDEFTTEDWKAIAEYAQAELQVRQAKRSDLTRQWKEIDRQLAMKPTPRKVVTGGQSDWYPAVEEPLQFNALEVIEADALNGIFPKTQPSWYEITVDTSGDYFARNDRAPVVDPSITVKMDQESADAIAKATMDYYLDCFDFRQRFALFVSEAIKYGTCTGRVQMVTPAQFTYEFRDTGDYKGPAFLPYSIKNTYLDDIPALVMHEGIKIAPLLMRTEERLYDDVRMAAAKGGKSKGWLESNFDEIAPKKKDKRGVINLIFMEGDLIVPRSGSQKNLYLPNTRTLVGVTSGGPAVIRFQENETQWHSNVVGHYMRQDVDSAYGVSPLMKGWPVQEACSFVLNDLLATSRLRAQPPTAWDRQDGALRAQGGPNLHPGAMLDSDNPDGIKALEIGDLQAALAAYTVLNKKYEDLTQANDPRRGAGVKSHTTTGAHQLDTMRSLMRTESFVENICDGPLPSVLYMFWALVREAVGTKGKSIPIDANGMKGFINVTKQLLPERVKFRVYGAAGESDAFQKKQAFFAAANFAVQLFTVAVQTGKPIDLDFVNLISEAFEVAGHQNTAKFVRRGQAVSPGTPGQSAVPGGGQVDTSALLGSLQALQGAV